MWFFDSNVYQMADAKAENCDQKKEAKSSRFQLRQEKTF